MTQRMILFLMFGFVVVFFGGIMLYDMKANNRLGTDKATNWNWQDNWHDGTQVNPIKPDRPRPDPIKPDTKPDSTDQIVASSYSEAIQKSSETGLPVLVVFSAEWCHWCKKLKNETLNDSSVNSAMKKFVFVVVDTDADKSSTKKFGIRSLPSYVITNHKEEKLKVGNGYKDANEFTSWLKN